MYFNLAVSLINPVLLIAILFLYRRADRRFNDLLTGLGFGLATLVGLALAGRSGSSVFVKLGDFSVIAFWLAAQLLAGSPLLLGSGAGETRAESLRLLVFNMLGLM